MRTVPHAIWWLAVGLIACSDVGSASREPITITIASWNADPSKYEVLEGATVCEMDTARCGVTDWRGETVLRLPVGEETAYTVDHPEKVPNLIPLALRPGETEVRTNVTDAQGMAAGHAGIGSPYPMRGTGTVIVQVIPGFVGVTYELVAATGNQFYHDEEYNMRGDLNATTSTGLGGFAEVTPGEVQLEAGGAAHDCLGATGWRSDIENAVRLPVREGYVTFAILNCVLPKHERGQ